MVSGGGDGEWLIPGFFRGLNALAEGDKEA